MITSNTGIRFIRIGDTLINLSQIIDIVILPGLPDSSGEVHIRTTAPDAEVHIFDGEDAAQLRALFSSAAFNIAHVYGGASVPMPPFSYREVSR